MTSPRDFLNVVDYLVPELQRRGRYKTEYKGKTLRRISPHSADLRRMG